MSLFHSLIDFLHFQDREVNSQSIGQAAKVSLALLLQS